MNCENETLQKLKIGVSILGGNSVLEVIEKMTNEQILKEHDISIKYNEKEKRYHCNIPARDNYGRRKSLASKTREDLENKIIEHYKSLTREKPTISNQWDRFLEYKNATTQGTTVVRYIKAYNSFYKDDPIVNEPLEELTTTRITAWLSMKIKEHHLTKQGYANCSVIVAQMFMWAYSEGIIKKNVFSDVHINTKLFAIPKPKKSADQVYLIDEEPLVREEAWQDFNNKNYCVPLTIPFLFETGLRKSEVVVIKWSDIDGCDLTVQRFERIYRPLVDGELKHNVYEINEGTKGGQLERHVYLSSEALRILSVLKEYYKQVGIVSEYVFSNEKGHIHHRAIDLRVAKYCNNINIKRKSPHKIRKTTISKLLDGGVNISDVMEMVGHKSKETTLNNYCFSRCNLEQRNNTIENALRAV